MATKIAPVWASKTSTCSKHTFRTDGAHTGSRTGSILGDKDFTVLQSSAVEKLALVKSAERMKRKRLRIKGTTMRGLFEI